MKKSMPRGLVPSRECYQRGGTKYEIRLGRKIPRTLVLSKPGLPLYLRFARFTAADFFFSVVTDFFSVGNEFISNGEEVESQ